MKINTKQIPEEGLHLEGSESAEILEMPADTAIVLSEVRYSLDVGLSEDGLFATGELGVDLECECVACLKNFRYALEVADFAAQIELHGKEIVDLTPFMREDIFLALPLHPRCDWNGANRCEGERLLKAVLGDQPEAVGEKPDAWKALDQLQIKDEPETK